MKNPQYIRNRLIPSLALAGLTQSGYASELCAYMFSSGSGSMVTDKSGNGLNGTLPAMGAAWAFGRDGGSAIGLSQEDDGFVNMANPCARDLAYAAKALWRKS